MATTDEFVPLPQLADVDGYRPTTFDYDPPAGSKDPRGGIPPASPSGSTFFENRFPNFGSAPRPTRASRTPHPSRTGSRTISRRRSIASTRATMRICSRANPRC